MVTLRNVRTGGPIRGFRANPQAGSRGGRDDLGLSGPETAGGRADAAERGNPLRNGVTAT